MGIYNMKPHELGFYGECLVICELAKRKTPTARLSPKHGDDLITFTGQRIEIKTSSHSRFRNHWTFKEIQYIHNNKFVNRNCDFFIFVCFTEKQSPLYFIIPYEVINKRSGITINYLDKKSKYHVYLNRWDLIKGGDR